MTSDNNVALAALALVGTALAAIIWIAKYFAKELSSDLKAHTKAAEQQVEASRIQATASTEAAAASKEVLEFMRNLNGKLAKVTNQTIKENE